MATSARTLMRPRGMVLGLLLVGLLLTAAYPMSRYVAMRSHIASLRAEQRELEERAAKLSAEKNRLRMDEEVERIARDELAYVRPGEVPFVVTNLPPASSPAPALEAPGDAISAQRRGVLGRIWDAFARAAHTIR